MLLQTEDFAKNLDSNEIEGKLISIKQELTKNFESEDNQDKREEILKDLSLISEVAVKVKQPITYTERVELIDEIKNRVSNFKAKYSDFFHSKVLKIIEDLELQLKAFKQIASSLALIETTGNTQNNANVFQQIYRALDKILQTIETYSSYIPGSVIQSLSAFSVTIIDIYKTRGVAREENHSEDIEDVSNSIRAINNVTKAILWEIEKIEDNNKEPEGFSSVGNLLEYIKTSSVWVGDDFEECLEDINRSRP